MLLSFYSDFWASVAIFLSKADRDSAGFAGVAWTTTGVAGAAKVAGGVTGTGAWTGAGTEALSASIGFTANAYFGASTGLTGT